MLEGTEETLVAFKFKDKLLIRSAHVFHLLVNHLLHLEQLSFVLLCHLVEVIVQDLQRVGEGRDLVGHLVANIANFRDVLEDLLLLVPEVLV